ncbi:type II toxin-antitoxin system HipA family toxin [Geminisphaera colitermitum]|uniref:type II toxin-antitoxin system HipA family toxin n=1 Tax=Geminisphaera colitermitum TaxID=1148786 RepID=UPI000158C4E2|nr:type II toxin-antitoxin system HipA family toxin [Geminisphaera colitermitum]
MNLKVTLHERTVGRFADDPASGRVYFQYDKDWPSSGLEISPLQLPAAKQGPYTHPAPTFSGLPGVFADSLPDHWGQSLLNLRLKEAGIDPETASPLIRLGYIGTSGMGALEYHPAIDSSSSLSQAVTLAQVDREASFLQDDRPVVGPPAATLALFHSGCSAGGAKPKVLAALLPGGNLRIGTDIPDGAQGWLIKLSTVPFENKDSRQEGRLEYAYSLMAKASGIEMSDTRLFEIDAPKGKRGLFGIRRFDRDGSRKLHTHSLSGLLHQSWLLCSYEDLAKVAHRLTRDHGTLTAIFRRLCFNVLARNCDDHGKNFSFTMSETGQWTLSPAFDLTHSPGPNKMGVHAMTVQRNRNPSRIDLLRFASEFRIKDAAAVLDQVHHAIGRWPEFANQAGLKEAIADRLALEFAESLKLNAASH